MKRIYLVLFIFLLAGCKKQNCECVIPFEVSYLKGVVFNSDFGPCSKPLVDFTEDSARLRFITGTELTTVLVTNLDPDLVVPGKKLYIDVKALSPSEDFACPATVSYSRVKALDAKPRN